MASDQVSSDPVPQCPTTELEQVSLSPGPQCQENVPHLAKTITTSNELDLLFSLMFDELLNGTTPVVSKSLAVTTADALNQRQQQHITPYTSTTVAADTHLLNIQTTLETTSQAPTQAPTVTAIENINQAKTSKEYAQVDEDEFINIFSTPVQERGETSSRYVDSNGFDPGLSQLLNQEARWVFDEEPEAPQSSGQALPSLDYVHGPEHPPLPDYVPGPEEPDWGYVVDSDLEEDPEEDPTDYPTDGGDDDDESSRDDVDNEDKEGVSKEEEDHKEEEHLAPADSSVVPVVDLVPSVEDTEAFKTDESAPTPSSHRPCMARICVRLEPPIAASMLACITEYAAIPSPPLPLPSPPTTSPTYAEAPLGYRAAKIRLRAASPSTHHPSEIPSPPLLLPSTTHKDDILEADMPLWKRACFSAPASRFEVGESLAAAANRKAGHALTSSVDKGFIDTVDVSVRASESRVI
ncbi:hypothetical protein Tco_1286307 [Tanacetum coccineum]